MGERATFPAVLRGHIPALDGLRGIAILLVMMLHFNVITSPEGVVDRVLLHGALIGWSGVDLFFVLSGFLITGILYRSKGQPGYFRNFYARRAVRIFPLYYAALTAVFLVLPSLFPSSGILNEIRPEQAWYWTYLSNVRVATAGFPARLTIGHFWSLAIEEQFYLAWPLVVFLLPRKHILTVSIYMAVAALVLRIYLVIHGHGIAAYVLTPARMDSLALGSALAIIANQEGGLDRMGKYAAPVLGVTTVLLAGVFILRRGLPSQDPVVQTVGYTLLSILFGALLVTAVRTGPGTLLNRILTASPFVFFGKYSYGIYVFHQPISGLLKRSLLDHSYLSAVSPLMTQLVFTFMATLSSIAAALISWNLFEKHFLKLKSRFEAPYPNTVVSTPYNAAALVGK